MRRLQLFHTGPFSPPRGPQASRDWPEATMGWGRPQVSPPSGLPSPPAGGRGSGLRAGALPVEQRGVDVQVLHGHPNAPVCVAGGRHGARRAAAQVAQEATERCGPTKHGTKIKEKDMGSRKQDQENVKIRLWTPFLPGLMQSMLAEANWEPCDSLEEERDLQNLRCFLKIYIPRPYSRPTKSELLKERPTCLHFKEAPQGDCFACEIRELLHLVPPHRTSS
ncbi:uncharacterized protein LOC144237640 [Crocuta crocuta]